MKSFNLKTKTIICFLLIAVVLSNFFSLAKYHTTVTGISIANIAKWNNNIELVSDSDIILNNNEENNQTLAFNLLSNSEVNSKYDININHIPFNIKTTLSNTLNSGSVFVDGTNITVGFDSVEETFIIPSTNTTSSSNGITLTSTITASSKVLLLEKTNENMKIKVEINDNDGLINANYMYFGTVNYGANQTVLHSLNFSTQAVQLPGINELELYATFEQLD